MKTSLVLLALLSSIPVPVIAQRIPVEVMAGSDHHRYQHHFAAGTDSSRFGLFHTSSLLIFKGEKENEIMSQSYLTYKLTGGIRLLGGLFDATGPGFRPSAAVHFFAAGPALFFLAAPRIDLCSDPSAEMMALAEYRPRLTRLLRLYARVQVMENFTGRVHNRSYQHVRVGVDVKQLQFGIAANMEAYGKEIHYLPSYGLFLRKEIK